MFSKHNKYRGMTLVELIIAMAILGIIMVSFLSMFTTGFVGIINASKHTDAGYDAQREMENSISTHSNIGTDEVYILFSDESGDPLLDVTIDSKGMILDTNVDHDGRTININTFVPNPYVPNP